MKKVTLKSIEFQNFLSFRSPQKFYFKSEGMHIIKGENLDMQKDTFGDPDKIKETNGSGKSSIVIGVAYALFGDTPKKIKTDNLINKKEGKNLLVSLEFDIDDKEYKIERYRKLSKRGSGLSLFFKENGEWVEESFSDVSLTQEKINEMISFNMDTFLYSVLVTKESTLNFIELPWHKRSQFLENIVRLDKLREYSKKVKENLSKDKKELDFVSKELYSSESSIKLLKDSIKKSIINKRTSKTNDELQKRVLLHDIDLLLKGNDIETLKGFARLVKLSSLERKGEEEISKVLKKLEREIKDRNKSYKDILSLLKKHQEALEIKKETCSTCQKEIERISSQEVLDSISFSIKKERENYNSSRIRIKEIISSLRDKRKDLDSIKKEMAALVHTKKELDKETKKIVMDDVLSGGDGLTYWSKVDELRQKVSEIENKKIDLSDIIHNREQLKTIRSEREILIVREKQAKRRIDIGEFWDSCLDFRNEGSLKNYIMGKVVPVFNSLLANLVSVIFEGTLQIKFDSSWNETIIYNGHDYDYNQLSLGEKAKINLCISLSLFSLMRINIGGTNVLFLDEVFSSMDESGIEKFLELIRSSFSNEIGTYIISHEKHSFTPDSFVVVSKKNGESVLSK